MWAAGPPGAQRSDAAQQATKSRQQDTRAVPLRYKTRPAHPFSPHVRYKTRPAGPFSPHVRYKTRPARPKRPIFAHFAHAWRTFYRMRGRDGASHHSTPGPTGVKGAGGTGGPGCGAGGRWRGLAGQHTETPTDWRPPRGLRGLAGLRANAPSEARGADGERAGRPRGGRRSVGATSNKQQARHTKTPTRNRVGASEPPVGIEPTTYSLRVNRSAD